MKSTLKYILMATVAVSLGGCTYYRGSSFDDIYDAAASGDSEALIEIIESGESLNALNSDNITPLCYAYMQNNETAIRHLQSYGANQGANCLRTKNGQPLMRYEPEHNPPQKQYPETMNNSKMTTTVIAGAALVGLILLIL